MDKTLAFYQNAFLISDIQIEDGIIMLEFPKLSLFLMKKDAFEAYSKKAGRGAQFPNGNSGMIISCAMTSREEIDTILENATDYGGSVTGKAFIDESYGGYTGYVADPDGHLWELVYPQQQS
ncbi:VOC family protein [Chitinophaga niabensis]|nr:glyoxalase [Chitinophaga niabensis]